MNRIAQLRKEKGLNQIAFAMRFNITQYMVSAYESGKNQPSIELLIQIADYFNVSLDYLLCRSDIRRKDDSLSEYEIQCLDAFGELDNSQKRVALGLLKCMKYYE